MMLKGFDENGVLRDVQVTEDGAVKVSMEESSNSGTSSTSNVEVSNEDTSPVPVKVMSGVNIPTEMTVNSDETTLAANVITASTTATTINVNKKVTQISIANYSETATVTITVGQSSFVVGSNIATELPINKTITSFSITASEADTTVQYIVKGEE